MSNFQTSPKPAKARIATIATRVAAGVGVAVAAVSLLGGSAFASGDDPIPGPILPPELLLDDLTVPTIPDFELIPIEPGDLPDLPLDTLPEDDGPPVLEIPDDILIPEIPELTIPEIPDLPLCSVWNPADMSVTSVDNGDLTATVTLSYADPIEVCDELFVVHSVQEDAAWTPILLLAEEHVTIADLQADADHSIAVIVPLDPCYTRVFTHGPEAYLLQDDHYGTGCPTETIPETVPEETVPEETVPPTDPTVPPTVPPTTPTTPTTAPGGTLPQTGNSSTTVIALLGGALVLAGGALAIGVRKSQTSSSSAGY